ncbi:hypothetical protein [Methylotenera sp.]|uniref:hypothetical protein n=1 Tax=Methylotenera sp. TaxID=2051956 RepID=UPI0024888122|nr:hypothetical protein [Methylotenera sp.]MDI1362514.1 hypothetical protein [Methylotenera sp.]
MLKIDNAREFNEGLDAWFVSVEDLAVQTLRGLSVEVFKKALENSPQFSGNAVANWKYSVDGIDTSHDDFFKDAFWAEIKAEWPLEVKAYSKQDPHEEAEQYALDANAGRQAQVKSLNNVIYVSNSVDYADWLATSTEAKLRTPNHVGHLISQTVADVVEVHLFISTAKAEQLGREVL